MKKIYHANSNHRVTIPTSNKIAGPQVAWATMVRPTHAEDIEIINIHN